MAPSHVVFDNDDVAAPKYARAPTPPLSASPTFSNKRPHQAGKTIHTNAAIKRPRVTHFRASDDEEEEEKSATSGPSFAKDGRVKMAGPGQASKVTEIKKKLRAEAERLEAGRRLLPIWEGKDAILQAIKDNDTIVILGETGSGKTTQVPQFLLRSEIPVPGPRICVTQPRRVAATSLATRVSAEAGSQLGDLVGYTVRFDDKSSRKTRLKYMTDGALLAEMLGDRDLNQYDVIILDEAHERSLRTDMLMGFLKDVQVRRKLKVKNFLSAGKEEGKGKGREKEARDPSELKIVVMSATIDAKRFSEFFNQAPVLFVKGRQHRVTVMYADAPVDDYCDAALKTIFKVHLTRPPGDILVFLPGQEDIENLASSITAYLPDLHKSHPGKGEILVCPLYARLSPADQAKAFIATPPNTRKVILATNVAETSVTIPGVKFVIDSGMAKEKEYHASVGIDTLVTESISRSSAMQRTGRAGRESAGVCYRLYTEKDFLSLARSTKPEIQRVSLTFALLHLLASGQDDVWSFQFMDRPEKQSIVLALMTLRGLGALDEKDGKILAFGKQMAALPLDPVYARVLLSSFDEKCPSDVIDLVSLLSARESLLINNAATREAANIARQKFHHRTGDHMMLLNILRAYEGVPSGDRKTWCRDNFINSRSMVQVLDTRKQLRERCERMDLDWDVSTGDEDEPVLGALVSGLFGNVALRNDDGTYRHSINKQVVAIHPGSIMHNKRAPAIIYDELVMTTKSYARGVSSIQLSWLQTKAPTVYNAKTAVIVA